MNINCLVLNFLWKTNRVKCLENANAISKSEENARFAVALTILKVEQPQSLLV